MTTSRINANTPNKFNMLHTGIRGNVSPLKINRVSWQPKSQHGINTSYAVVRRTPCNHKRKLQVILQSEYYYDVT